MPVFGNLIYFLNRMPTLFLTSLKAKEKYTVYGHFSLSMQKLKKRNWSYWTQLKYPILLAKIHIFKITKML